MIFSSFSPQAKRHGVIYSTFPGLLFSSVHLGGKHVRILRPGIARRSQNSSFGKAGRSKLFEEGTAFLRSSDSPKPVYFAFQNLWGKRSNQYEFGRVNSPTWSHDSSELLEDCVPRRIQVKDPIDQGNINYPISNRQVLDIGVVKLGVVDPEFCCRLAGTHEH
jgi:hypothetical protein